MDENKVKKRSWHCQNVGKYIKTIKLWKNKVFECGQQHYIDICSLFNSYHSKKKFDVNKVMEWWTELTKGKYSNGIIENQIGDAYRDGTPVKKNMKKAMKWYLKSAEYGNAMAQYNLAICYESIEKDPKKILFWLLKSAEQNYFQAQCYLSDYYSDGIDTPIDYIKSRDWLTKAFIIAPENEKGNIANKIGYSFEHQNEKDMKEAVKWYMKGVEYSNSEAEYNLAICYEEGTGIEQDNKKAFDLAVGMREKMNNNRLLLVGRYYSAGIGTSVDNTESRKWLMQALFSAPENEKGSIANEIGCTYEHENEQELKEAIKWYIKGAEHGNRAAIHNLSTFYENNSGTEQDNKKLFNLALKLVENFNSSVFLTHCYHDGIGTPIDYMKAINLWTNNNDNYDSYIRKLECNHYHCWCKIPNPLIQEESFFPHKSHNFITFNIINIKQLELKEQLSYYNSGLPTIFTVPARLAIYNKSAEFGLRYPFLLKCINNTTQNKKFVFKVSTFFLFFNFSLNKNK